MTSDENRGAGRPREFELQVAVESALEVFWGRSFAKVSVSELEDASGIVRTSLYNAFGNKRGLFNAALDHYLAGLFAEINGRLTQGTQGLDDIHQFLDRLQAAFGTSTKGCLMVNSMIEFGAADPLIGQRGSDYIKTLTKGFRAALDRSQKREEISAAVPIETTADQLTLQILGLNLAVRNGLDPQHLQRLFKAAHNGLRALESTADR